MKNGIVIADAGPIFSLAVLGKLELLNALFSEIKIPHADFLLIDDKKARKIAENFGLNCIGTIGLLASAKRNGLLSELAPLFRTLIDGKRYYSIELLNQILINNNELPLTIN